MDTILVRYDVKFDVIECYKCGVLFGMTHELNQRFLRNHGESFHCPNGHSQVYVGKTEAEKLRDQLQAEQSRHANTQLELMMKEKQVKKLEKRAKNGACPCCHRQFVQLARHMKTKHLEFSR